LNFEACAFIEIVFFRVKDPFNWRGVEEEVLAGENVDRLAGFFGEGSVAAEVNAAVSDGA